MTVAKTRKPTPLDIYKRFHTTMNEIKSHFVDRGELIDMIATALICKEHAFFLSPPGTAKTALVRCIGNAISMRFFGVQMRDDTKTEEILGMWDLQELEKGRYVRNWSRLASCEIGYINEAFKGSSNALNSMLGAINEREVDDENGYRAIPLWTAILDSNELPRDKQALAAFFDRVVLKMPVDYIEKPVDFVHLLKGPDNVDPLPVNTVSLKEIETLHYKAGEVAYYPHYYNHLVSLRAFLQIEGIRISDRTWAKACGDRDFNSTLRVTPIKARAFLAGRKVVEPQDLMILENVLWTDPVERDKIRKAIMKACMPEALKAEKLLDEVIDAYNATLARPDDNDVLSDAIALSVRVNKKLTDLTEVPEEMLEGFVLKVQKLHSEMASKVTRI